MKKLLIFSILHLLLLPQMAAFVSVVLVHRNTGLQQWKLAARNQPAIELPLNPFHYFTR